MFKVPKGVVVDGVQVGNLSRSAAFAKVSEKLESDLFENPLVVHGERESYVFAYPDIIVESNLSAVLKRARRGKSYSLEKSFTFPELNKKAEDICRNERVLPQNAVATFIGGSTPFLYDDGVVGKEPNEDKLVSDIKRSLKANLFPVYVESKTINPQLSLSEVKNCTKLLANFTTYFDEQNENRAHNIRLSAQKINGTILHSGESFSFNQTVGERTLSEGFKRAKIIERGEFVEGIGGGVCQVSTTLYNCALLSGLEIEEFHPHTLAVSYVPPSRDAMVSGKVYDLKIFNSFPYPVYIGAECKKGGITFSIYGRDDGSRFSFITHIVGTIARPEEVTNDESLVRDGRDGLYSEGYLVCERGGVTSRTLVRKDKYLPIKKYSLAE